MNTQTYLEKQKCENHNTSFIQVWALDKDKMKKQTPALEDKETQGIAYTYNIYKNKATRTSTTAG